MPLSAHVHRSTMRTDDQSLLQFSMRSRQLCPVDVVVRLPVQCWLHRSNLRDDGRSMLVRPVQCQWYLPKSSDTIQLLLSTGSLGSAMRTARRHLLDQPVLRRRDRTLPLDRSHVIPLLVQIGLFGTVLRDEHQRMLVATSRCLANA